MIWDAMDAGGMSSSQWGALGVVVAALITAAGVWVTSRVTKANAATTAKVQADANAVAGLSGGYVWNTARYQVAPYARIGCEVCVADQRTDAQAALSGGFDLVERQAVDVLLPLRCRC